MRWRWRLALITVSIVVATQALTLPGANATSNSMAGSGCSFETVQARGVGTLTIRFKLIGGVSCHKAHHLVGAWFRAVRHGHPCGGNRCLINFRGGWTCGYITVGESASAGGASAGCARHGAKIRVYSVLQDGGFLSPDKKIWCQASAAPQSTQTIVGCNSSPQVPSAYGGTVTAQGQVTVCHQEDTWHCFQNFGTGVPVLPYGQSAEALGFRCTSEPNGITCITVSGTGAGEGFLVNTAEAIEVGPHAPGGP